MEAIGRKIFQQVGSGQSHRNVNLNRWLLRIAAVFIPLLVLTIIVQQMKTSRLNDELMTVATAKGENASITLPDGTRVKLNEGSTLTYHPHAFTKKSRSLEFNGEAYFEVAKDSLHPFTIHGEQLTVTVLGTKFNLDNRRGQRYAVVALAEGRVRLNADRNGDEATMLPNERSTFDKLTCHITTDRMTGGIDDITSWARKELVFNNSSIHDIVSALERHYRVNIEIAPGTNLSATFTGTIPSNNFNEDLGIICAVYHCKASFQKGMILLSK